MNLNTNHKMYALLLIFTIVANTLNAVEITIDNMRFLLSTDNKEATLLSCTYEPDTLDIPEWVLYKDVKYSVKKIASGAFPDNNTTIKLSVPNSVVTIESNAFGSFSALRDIFVGHGVDSLSGHRLPFNAYMETYRINNQNILDNFCHYVRQGATSIKAKFNMVVGDDISTIGENAFRTNAYVPDFWMKTLTLGKSVTQINSNFNDCSFLEAIYAPSVESWCKIEFKYTNGISGKDKLYFDGEYVTELVIPEGIEKINNYAFSNATQFTSLTLPSTLKEIGDYAFYWCSQITSELQFLENIVIGEGAFYNCWNMKGITLPDNVGSIGEDAFDDCTGLEYISVNTNTPYEILRCCKIESVTSLYLRGDLQSWMKYNEYSPFRDCQHLFLNGEEIVDLLIPDGILSVYSSFLGCDGIESVTFPESCVEISDNAFERCDNIKTLYLTENIRTIGAGVFANSVDNHITIHTPSLSAWMKIKFGNDWSWSSTLPKNCSIIIGNKSLYDRLEIPSDIDAVQNGAFCGFKKLNEVIIHENVKSIGAYAFDENDNLSKVTVYATTPPECHEKSFDYSNSILYVPKGCIAAYSEATGWKEFTQIEEHEYTGINTVLENTDESHEYYSIGGVRLDAPEKGIVIVRDKNNDTKRVLVR